MSVAKMQREARIDDYYWQLTFGPHRVNEQAEVHHQNYSQVCAFVQSSGAREVWSRDTIEKGIV